MISAAVSDFYELYPSELHMNCILIEVKNSQITAGIQLYICLLVQKTIEMVSPFRKWTATSENSDVSSI